MKVIVEFNNGSKKEFENVNYIGNGFDIKSKKEFIGIYFIDDEDEDKDIYKEDIKSISTYEEYKNGVESWRDKENSKQ